MNNVPYFLAAAGIATAISLAVAPNAVQASHVLCGDFLTSSTTLDANLDCDDGQTGLVILADNVTLDLGGFTVTGPSLSPDTGASGVAIFGSGDVTVRNGTIVGFDRGVSAVDVFELKLQDLVIRDQLTAHGISVIEGREVAIMDTSVFGPGPFQNGTNAIRLDDVSDVNVQNSILSGFEFGVFAICSDCLNSEFPNNGQIQDSSFSGLFSAIALRHARDFQISRNVITGSLRTSIEAGFGGPIGGGLNIQNNFIYDNNRGIALLDVVDSRIFGNRIQNNNFEGIALLTSGGGSVDNLIGFNTTFGNLPDLFHDLSSTPNNWKDNSCVSKVGADIPNC